MNILMIGDIYGRPGRHALATILPRLQQEYPIDFVIANGENAAGGVGLTEEVYHEIRDAGVDIVTSGNHIWDKKEIFNFIDHELYLVRPGNYPSGTPGVGYRIASTPQGPVGVLNLAGRVFMPDIDCPFRIADQMITEMQEHCKIIMVDFHAEATSEKMALAWYLDGRISCLAGTHTHIATADERLLKKGTAYISDIGMVGPWDSVLGVDRELVIKKFITGLPVRFETAKGPTVFAAILVEVDNRSGCATRITRIQRYGN